MVGRGGICRASGLRGQRGLSYRAQEYSLGGLLSLKRLVVFAVREYDASRGTILLAFPLRFSPGASQQDFGSNAPIRAVVVRKVAEQARGLQINSWRSKAAGVSAGPPAAIPRPSAFEPQLLLRLAPFFALAPILGLVTVWFQSHRAMSGNLYQRDGLIVRLLDGTWAVWFYLGKALLPVNLSMIYPRWEVNPAWVWTYAPAFLWWTGLGVCWWFRRVWGRAVLFGLVCFFVTLLPVLGFFDMSFYVYSRVADHLQYLALLGVIAVVVGGAGFRFQDSSLGFPLSAGAVMVELAFLTWIRASVFKGQETLWRDTLAKNPWA